MVFDHRSRLAQYQVVERRARAVARARRSATWRRRASGLWRPVTLAEIAEPTQQIFGWCGSPADLCALCSRRARPQ